jgi:hypothetical protein
MAEYLSEFVPGAGNSTKANCRSTAECIFSYSAVPFLPVMLPMLKVFTPSITRSRLIEATFPGLNPPPMRGYTFLPRGSYTALEYTIWTSYDPFDETQGAATAKCAW